MRLVTVPDPAWVDRLHAMGAVGGLTVRHWDLSAEPPDSGIGFVVPMMGHPERFPRLATLPRLEVVQVVTAGFDHVLSHLPPGVTLCNAAGVHDAATAEFAVALVLASLRGIPEFVAAQQRAAWVPLRTWPALAGRRVLVVGYGRIGHAVAARLAPFEVRLTAVARGARGGDGIVDRVHGVDELPGLLPEQDVVVLLTPLAESTRGLVDAAFLAALPDGALVVNVARGAVVDTDALLAETASGRLRAALDVHAVEPLPTAHALWRTPGVLVTPHVGGAGDTFEPRMLALLHEQLTRYAAGAPLLNVVRAGH